MSTTSLVSILIPVFNNYRFVEQLHKSLVRHSPADRIEIIYIDNGSTEEGMEQFYSSIAQENVKIVRNSRNLGFGRANNIGYSNSVGEYLCLLNSDMLVTSGWLEPLIDTFEKCRECGAVQSRILLVDDGPISGWKTQTCGAAFDQRGLPTYYLSGFPADAPEVTRPLSLQAFMGTGVMLRRTVVERVGFFEPEYDLVFMEDTDLSLRISEAGFSIRYEPRSLLYHFHSTSMPHLSQEEYDRSRLHNIDLFRKKWPPERIAKIVGKVHRLG